jgi:hypothetical protein
LNFFHLLLSSRRKTGSTLLGVLNYSYLFFFWREGDEGAVLIRERGGKEARGAVALPFLLAILCHREKLIFFPKKRRRYI